MKEYRMLETRKGEAEALMNWMAREGWEVVGVTYWSAWKLCLLITFSRELPPEKGRGNRDEKNCFWALGCCSPARWDSPAGAWRQ